MEGNDFFEGILPSNGQQQDAPAAEELILGPEHFEEGEPGSQQGQGAKQETPSAGDPSHYQALYDRSQQELQLLKDQNSLLRQQFQLMTQPQQGGQPQPAQGQPQGEESLARPERPVRPQRYDPIDATTDPSSESWRYREAMEGYTERMAEYMDGLQERSLRQAQEQAERQAQQTRVAAANSQLMNTYGMSVEEVRDFWAVMNSPESMSLDNLHRLYRVIKGQPIAANAPRSRAPIPPVPTVKGGSGQTAGSVEDRIFDDLLRQSNRANNF